jgi:hypothetical protein
MNDLPVDILLKNPQFDDEFSHHMCGNKATQQVYGQPDIVIGGDGLYGKVIGKEKADEPVYTPPPDLAIPVIFIGLCEDLHT